MAFNYYYQDPQDAYNPSAWMRKYYGTFDDETGTCRESPKKIMKLSSMMKRLLDKDVQTLIKAGFLDSNLGLTLEGQQALFAMLFVANKAELVKVAQEKIDEEEKSK